VPVFNDALGNITHTEGSRVVWSTTRRPALLLHEQAVTLNNFDISFPDFAKSNCYGFAYATDMIGFDFSSCVSMVSLNPQEYDSGLSFVCNLPAGANYFETEITLSRIISPSTFLDVAIPDVFGSGARHMPDGNSAIVEAIGPMVRMFSFEQIIVKDANGVVLSNKIYLRRKQSITNAGAQVAWNSGNNNNTGSGGYRAGWTYGGDPNAWPSYRIDSRNSGGIDKRRGSNNQCSLSDPTNYASTWRGTVTITPGYIKL
jgi:hypothetical protein